MDAGGETKVSMPAPEFAEAIRPFIGRWFEDKSQGDVSSLDTFLTACSWSWPARKILTNAPNQMWEVRPAAAESDTVDDQTETAAITFGVEANAVMKQLVSLVGAAPFVRSVAVYVLVHALIFASVDTVASMLQQPQAIMLLQLEQPWAIRLLQIVLVRVGRRAKWFLFWVGRRQV